MAGNEPSYWGSVGRSALEGLSFNNAGELEAMVRSGVLGQGDYYKLKADLERRQKEWAAKNVKADLAAQFGGALLPAVAGAFVPGPGWAATASTGARALSALPRIARVMAEPVTVAAERFAPRVAANLASRGPLARAALPLADELLTGVVQSIGSANTMRDAPSQIAQDLPVNAAGSLAVRGVSAGGKRALAALRARRNAR
jgi:hypothetical protein